MNVNEIISKINNMNLQSEEDLQEVESVLTEIDDALIEPLFRLLERHPHFNFGNPGRVVHYLEKFDNNTYAPFYMLLFVECLLNIIYGCSTDS